MVPEQHRRALGGIICLGKLQKVRQRLRLTHAGRRLLVDELQALAVIDPALELGGVHHVVLPYGRAAGLNDHVHVFGKLHLQELTQIARGKATAGLQIAAAQVPVDRPASRVGGNCLFSRFGRLFGRFERFVCRGDRFLRLFGIVRTAACRERRDHAQCQ